MKPIISVIVAAYNQAEYLGDCLTERIPRA